MFYSFTHGAFQRFFSLSETRVRWKRANKLMFVLVFLTTNKYESNGIFGHNANIQYNFINLSPLFDFQTSFFLLYLSHSIVSLSMSSDDKKKIQNFIEKWIIPYKSQNYASHEWFFLFEWRMIYTLISFVVI